MAKYVKDIAKKKQFSFNIPLDLYDQMMESIKIRSIVVPDIRVPENVTSYLKNLISEDYSRNINLINKIKKTDEFQL